MLMIIACLTMLIDHIGLLFFPDQPIFRVVGRLALPIYAFLLVNGYSHTQSITRYCRRIIIIAVFSQVPYMVMINEIRLNICFSWLLGIIAIDGIENTTRKKFSNVILLILAFIVSTFVPMDYGIYAVLWTMLFLFRKKIGGHTGNVFAVIGAFGIQILWKTPIQICSLLAIPIIIFLEQKNYYRLKSKTFKKIYQIFYPVHMLILDILYVIICRI